MRETEFGCWQLMDGLQTARLPLDSMITRCSRFLSVFSCLSSISVSPAFSLYLFFPPSQSWSLLNPEMP